MKKQISDIILASDIDGTLITEDFYIPQDNITEIHDFIHNGGNFSVVTGRSVNAAKMYIEKIGPNLPCVVYNGAALYDFSENKFLWNTQLPPESAEYLEKIKNKFPSVGIEIFGLNNLAVIKENQYTKERLRSTERATEYTSPENVNLPWIKVLFADRPEVINEVIEFCRTFKHEKVRFVSSAGFYVEMLPIDANKGTALKMLAGLNKKSVEDVYAIGDYYNDEEMLRLAGVSAVPDEAPSELKAIADVVVCSCKKGAVADFIKYIYGHLS